MCDKKVTLSDNYVSKISERARDMWFLSMLYQKIIDKDSSMNVVQYCTRKQNI